MALFLSSLIEQNKEFVSEYGYDGSVENKEAKLYFRAKNFRHI
jgi:hypothetical protein